MSLRGFYFNVYIFFSPLGIRLYPLPIKYMCDDQALSESNSALLVTSYTSNSMIHDYITPGDFLIAINNVSMLNPTIKDYSELIGTLKLIKLPWLVQFFRPYTNGPDELQLLGYSYNQHEFRHRGYFINNSIVADMKLLNAFKDPMMKQKMNMPIPSIPLPPIDKEMRDQIHNCVLHYKNNFDIQFNDHPKTELYSDFEKHYEEVKKDPHQAKANIKRLSLQISKQVTKSSTEQSTKTSTIAKNNQNNLNMSSISNQNNSPETSIQSNNSISSQKPQVSELNSNENHDNTISYPILPFQGTQETYIYFPVSQEPDQQIGISKESLESVYTALKNYVQNGDTSLYSYLSSFAIRNKIEISTFLKYMKSQEWVNMAYNVSKNRMISKGSNSFLQDPLNNNTRAPLMSFTTQSSVKSSNPILENKETSKPRFKPHQSGMNSISGVTSAEHIKNYGFDPVSIKRIIDPSAGGRPIAVLYAKKTPPPYGAIKRVSAPSPERYDINMNNSIYEDMDNALSIHNDNLMPSKERMNKRKKKRDSASNKKDLQDLPETQYLENAKKSLESSISSFSLSRKDKSHKDSNTTEDMNVNDEDNLTSLFGETFERNVFNVYKPKKYHDGLPHPSAVVESSALAGISLPDIYYKLSLPSYVIKEGRLSDLQLEAISYICQRQEMISPSGTRSGFLLGDGAGIGKGREIAGVIYEYWSKGIRKAIWISESPDLYFDACRDLKDLGANIPIFNLREYDYGVIKNKNNSPITEGILFLTYMTLLQNKKSSSQSRYNQILEWCHGKSYEGVLILDECHKGKNTGRLGEEEVKESKQGSKTSRVIIKLQEDLPLARVLYSSATGASSPANMGYMTRLGLWGPTSCLATFADFRDMLVDGGIGIQEIIACDMKRMGMYICRQVSFHGTSFSVDKVILNHYMREMYNKSVTIWQELDYVIARDLEILKKYQAFQEKPVNDVDEELIDEIKVVNPRSSKAYYWASHQRFFKNMLMAFKIPRCVEIVQQALKENKSVVIGLISTGEARMSSSRKSMDCTNFISLARETLRMLIQKGILLPTIDDESKERIEKSVEDVYHCRKTLNDDGDYDYEFDESGISNLTRDQNQFFITLSENDSIYNVDNDIYADYKMIYTLKLYYLYQCNTLSLPYNPLDILIDLLGGDSVVAEMTGRTHRMVRHGTQFVYEARGIKRGSLEGINMIEKEAFNDGSKRIAIISDAASSGISLHSDKRFKNTQKRLHIILEMPWSADKAIQQCGRTNRSNQRIPPEYIYLITDVDGENRFISSSAKRLKAMGAILQGDRKASGVYNLSDYDYDTPTGRKAFQRLLDNITTPDTASKRELPLGIENTVLSNLISSEVESSINSKDSIFNSICVKGYKEGDIRLTKNPFQNLKIRLMELHCVNVDTCDKEKNILKSYSRSVINNSKKQCNLLKEMAVWVNSMDMKKLKTGDYIKNFFNKVLSLKLYQQNLLVGYFDLLMEIVTMEEIQNNIIHGGVTMITGKHMEITCNDVLFTDKLSNVSSYYIQMKVNRGLKFEEALSLRGDPKTNGFYKSRRPFFGKILVLLAVKLHDDDANAHPRHNLDQYTIHRPATGKQLVTWTFDHLDDKYMPITDKEAEIMWKRQLYDSSIYCSHGPSCHVRNCEQGKCIQTIHFVTGIYIYIWNFINQCVGGKKKPRLIQVNLDNCERRGIVKGGKCIAGTNQPIQDIQEFINQKNTVCSTTNDVLELSNSLDGDDDDILNPIDLNKIQNPNLNIVVNNQNILTGVRIEGSMVSYLKKSLVEYEKERNILLTELSASTKSLIDQYHQSQTVTPRSITSYLSTSDGEEDMSIKDLTTQYSISSYHSVSRRDKSKRQSKKTKMDIQSNTSPLNPTYSSSSNVNNNPYSFFDNHEALMNKPNTVASVSKKVLAEATIRYKDKQNALRNKQIYGQTDLYSSDDDSSSSSQSTDSENIQEILHSSSSYSFKQNSDSQKQSKSNTFVPTNDNFKVTTTTSSINEGKSIIKQAYVRNPFSTNPESSSIVIDLIDSSSSSDDEIMNSIRQSKSM